MYSLPLWSWLAIITVSLVAGEVQSQARSTTSSVGEKTEFKQGLITGEKVRWEKQQSPYLVRRDIIIGEDGELIIEPGVTVFFAPTVGITVYGVLTAKGDPNDRIVLTAATTHPESATARLLETWQRVRLTDGPNVHTGRLQIYHNEEWRSVCTNSRNWTKVDLDAVCRQMGFQGGRFWRWMDRETGISRPHLLLEKPNCQNGSSSIFSCQWPSRQLGSGVCEYHPDLGIECNPYFEKLVVPSHWAGIHFKDAKFNRPAIHHNTLYVRKSLSQLLHVDINYAGSGRDYQANSAVQVEGVPPLINSCVISFSAYNGINVTDPQAPVTLINTTLTNNRGYGLYVNTSFGGTFLDNCTVEQNGADGVRFLHHEDTYIGADRISSTLDFCTVPITPTQTFPIIVNVEQSASSQISKDCPKNFYTRHDQVLTLLFKHLRKSENGNAKIEIFDGFSSSDNLLAVVNIRNNTRPQSVTTTGNNVFVRFTADARTEVFGTMTLLSSYGKWYDLSVVDSTVADNNGRGIAVENVQSQLHLKRTSVSNNKHVAGVHVLYGAAYVNISESRIAFNHGDGVNISYAGGVRNVSDSFISSNRGFGVAVWLNLTSRWETFMREYWQEEVEYRYVAHSQETVVAYNEIFRNLESGIMVGNFCGNSFVNVSGNWFNNSVGHCVEIQSCWRNDRDRSRNLMTVQVGNNYFAENRKLALKMTPLVNAEVVVEYNSFKKHSYGAILIRNGLNELLNRLFAKVTIKNNEFYENTGVYVINMGLSPYSETQKLLFTWNYVKENRIKEPFQNEAGITKLIPRSKVAAPIVVSSENTLIYRNIIENPNSEYEIGSHLEDQSLVINCTYNWLGSAGEDNLHNRIFNRKDRYNLAKIEFYPYLLHSSNPATNVIRDSRTYIPKFMNPSTGKIGGEVDGWETLKTGDYFVERDINVRPGGKLTFEAGVTLKFPPGIGMMVAGKFEARGRGSKEIRLTLNEERNEVIGEFTNETATEYSTVVDGPPVRLVGGRTPLEGRLQVLVNGKWGTVCNYGWTIESAALVCHQLGYVLNPNDWLLEYQDIPQAGILDPILLSNVKCADEDLDITKCRAERENEFENSCNHDHDVGLRCHEPKWAGVRFGVLADRTNLQFLAIEHAGLLDYATNQLKPALQIDLNRHVLENIRLSENIDDGLGVIYSDLYSLGVSNIVKNCEIKNNEGSGISIKQFGLKVSGSQIMKNKIAGIRHDPMISLKQQLEIAGWFKLGPADHNDAVTYAPIHLPRLDEHNVIDFTNEGDTKYIITERLHNSQQVTRTYTIKAKPHLVLGIQILNPIHNESTEQISIYDGQSLSSQIRVWDLRKDLMSFPTMSKTHGILLRYESGSNAMGNVIIIITSTTGKYDIRQNRAIYFDSFPTLLVTGTHIKENGFGIWNSYYNSYQSEFGDHYLRKSNETLCIVDCDISYNQHEVLLVQSNSLILDKSNMSETTIIINGTTISKNGRGLRHFSRDLRNSNNLFHWYMYKNVIDRNAGGGFEVTLPYVWSYNENYTHSVVLENNTWSFNDDMAFILDGHYAQLNMSGNIFQNNTCKHGLISIRGMEKSMRITRNVITNNRGVYMVEFKANSQSEIRGELKAVFFENTLKKNIPPSPETPTSLIVFDGIQRVRIRRNLMSNNGLAYALVAGVKTARIDSKLDISENWWGTIDYAKIKRQIFDFNDWNDHALAIFRPYLIEDDFESSVSVSFESSTKVDVDNLSGRLMESLILPQRLEPYVILSDLTVMPDVTLTIDPGVTLEFGPRVGLLVLGTLIAMGRPDAKIIMKPYSTQQYTAAKLKRSPIPKRMVRLCIENNCTEAGRKKINEGFLEFWNTTTLQWVPLCDETFVEQNARVVCRQLGLGSLSAWVSRGRRYEFLPNALTRIWSWPEPLQCAGEEESLDDCPERLNEQLLRNERRVCNWDSNFVFIHCGDADSVEENLPYWGGVRLTNGEFEWNNYKDRIHDPVTHESVRHTESILEDVEIIGAGVLHYQKSPAILAVFKSPAITRVNVTQSASSGISLISPGHDVKLLSNRVERCLDTGISIAALTGEGRENTESSFTPTQKVDIPYNTFGMLDMCDPLKEIFLQEKVLLYYKYNNNPVSCIKIFHSDYRIKSFGIRFLQLNLFNESDTLTLYDGSIYNVSSPIVSVISSESKAKKQFLTTNGTSLSVKMVVSGAAQYYGFIAEVVTLPISAITFNRDLLHNVSYSVLKDNWAGALFYVSVGEVNPRLTMEWNQITNNCRKLWGNFTSCDSAVTLDLQNTQNLHFRNNLVRRNIGGLWIKADSVGSATSLKAMIHNNLFADNEVKSVLRVEGRRSSPYQDVVIYRNYFAKNFDRYENVIVLNQVMSNFTFNFVQNNWGSHILEVSGFDGVRLPIFQTTSHNGFYWNEALERDSKSTILAGTAGQHYIDNIFSNPANDYEIITVNTSFIYMWRTSIDARYNYWGYNETYAVGGRIHDHQDNYRLMEVDFLPYHMVNDSLLDGKCPPAWNLVGDTCYIFIGAPMGFFAARDFCLSVNASMPYLTTSYAELIRFLQRQQEYFMYYDRVWVQNINRINKCTAFYYSNTEEFDCDVPLPFICEMDPKVSINVLSWTNDVLTIAVFSSVMVLFLLLALFLTLWYSKSRHRHVERLQRRNSIRQSLNSLRSLSSSQTAFNEFGYKRKGLSSQTTNLSLSRTSDYKKMNGSLDSMDKSQFNSSLEEDTQSYDIYEAHNPNAAAVSAEHAKNNYIDLAYQNHGYRTNSSFASRDDDTWRSSSYANNCSTLPLSSGVGADDSTPTVSSRQDYQRENEYHEYYERPKSSATLLETNFDLKPTVVAHPPVRSKSETLLETNFDYMLPTQDAKYSVPSGGESFAATAAKSKSQPLETAM